MVTCIKYINLEWHSIIYEFCYIFIYFRDAYFITGFPNICIYVDTHCDMK